MNKKVAIKLVVIVIALSLVLSLGYVAITETIKNKAFEDLLIFSVEETSFCASYNNMTFDELQNLFLEHKAEEIINGNENRNERR